MKLIPEHDIFLLLIVIVPNIFAIFACVLVILTRKKMRKAIYRKDTGEHIILEDYQGNEIDKKIKINIR